MEDAKVTLQSLKDWCIILMNLAIKASGTHWGRLMLLMAAVLLVNNLLALIRAIGVLVKIPISVVRLVYKVMAYVVGLLTRMAIFPFRLLWNMTVFLYHRLF